MTAPKTVYCVVGDLGGAKEVLPIARELEKRGVTVKWFLDSSPKAKAGDVLAKAGITHQMTGEVNLGNIEKPSAMLIGTSATANKAQVDWTWWGQANLVPVIWMEDLHGTGSRANSRSVAPDAMLCIDVMAADIAKKVRPGLQTVVVGKPTFSDPKEMPRLEDGPAIRAKVRAELGIGDGDYLIVVGFGGDPAERAETQLDVLLSDALQLFSFRNSVVAWRFHPKHPKAVEMYERAVAAMADIGVRTIDARKTDMNHLTIAADACIADWGNTNQLAAVLHGTPLVTMMFPPDPRLVDTYPPDGRPPVVAGNQQFGAETIYHLRHWIGNFSNPDCGYRKYTREVRGVPFQTLLLPGAAERAADAVMQEMELREAYRANHDPELTKDMLSASSWLHTDGLVEDKTKPEEPECGNCGCGHG